MEGMIGEVRGFAGVFAPRSWAICAGQLLAISSNTALYSIIGTNFGGDGRSSFALPDARGRAIIGAGTGPGLTPYGIGARSGLEYVTLNVTEIPAHTHTSSVTINPAIVNAPISGNATTNASLDPSPSNDPTGRYWAKAPTSGPPQALVYGSTKDVQMSADAVEINGTAQVTISGLTGSANVGYTGNNSSHYNMQPFLAMYWIIAMFGIYPSRN